MPTVDEHQKLHPGGPSVIEQRVERGPNRAAGVEDVVHEDDVLPGDGEIDFSSVDYRLLGDSGKVVAIKVDVEDADRNGPALERLDLGGKTLRKRYATAADTDKGKLLKAIGFLENFVSQANERTVDLAGGHQLSFFACGGHAF